MRWNVLIDEAALWWIVSITNFVVFVPQFKKNGRSFSYNIETRPQFDRKMMFLSIIYTDPLFDSLINNGWNWSHNNLRYMLSYSSARDLCKPG